MMQAGIFAKTFQRENVLEVCKAVRDYGFGIIQFNMSCAGLASIPDFIPQSVLSAIRQAVKSNDLEVGGVSATFNMCHPDPKHRTKGLERLEVLAKNCKSIGTDLITLCTGTRDWHDKWKFHPENSTKEAWRDMQESMEKALVVADQYDICLGIEPELANVVSNAQKAHQLLIEMKSPRLKIILDPANLYERADLPTIKYLIAEAIDLLAASIIMTHAKDRTEAGEFVAPGKGIIPFDYFIEQLQAVKVERPIIAHGFPESEVKFVTSYLKALLE